MPSDSPWSGWKNAEIYDAFVSQHGIYRALNRRLVELAEVATARRVLDLACGGGATARACLEVLPARGELVGVDGSEAMVRVARARVRDPRARFEVAPAAALERVAPGPFDRAVSNAAFWQFPDRRSVLAALARVTEKGALLVFNVPDELLAGSRRGEPAGGRTARTAPGEATEEGGPEAAQPTPFQVALSRAVEARSGHPPPAASPFDPDRLADRLTDAGFELAARVPFAYRARQAELMELMAIPAMLHRLAPDLPEPARQSALAEARQRTEPDQQVTIPWTYFVARRHPS
jgi:SAM-dependent methyltransferase